MSQSKKITKKYVSYLRDVYLQSEEKPSLEQNATEVREYS